MSKSSTQLRVGYVSGDLRMHPVGLFFMPVLAHHNPEVVIPFIYDNGRNSDALSQQLEQIARSKHADARWRRVTALNDADLIRCIQADGIDVLVDLSGHTGQSRLTAFAYRPAPVQISWLGYFATTGLPTMDFVILDHWHAPPGTEAQFTERIIRLPHNRFCYRPVSFAPSVSPPSTFRVGHIRFGSFNNTAKLNEEVLSTWAEILHKVPNSRLILKWRTFADDAYRERVLAGFADNGIARERIELRPASVHRDLLNEYADIDIALDPFPFSGGYTSCEALWMGVPVVTWPQDRVVSRQTWSFLNNIGLAGLAAHDRAGYIELAVKLANSPDLLAELRSGMRARMLVSPLCDAAGFTRNLEAAYQLAWQEKSRES